MALLLRMKCIPVLAAAGCLMSATGICRSGTSLLSLPSNATETLRTPPTRTRTRTASATPTVPSLTPTATATITLTPTKTPTPSLKPDAWQSMPIVPVPSETARRIYYAGLGLKNDPHAFSILGDCLSLPGNLFGEMGNGPNHYKLGPYTALEPAVEWFSDSFGRYGITRVNGFNTAAVLSPLMANPMECQTDESPMACEYRVHHPSFAIIALGTDDNTSSPEAYEERMRKIIEYTIDQGIVPILATKADNREGNHAFNRIVASLSYEYGLPMWNFWAAVQPLPLHGLIDNRGHLTWADPDDLSSEFGMTRAVPVHTLTALQTLDSVWRGVTVPKL
jgi:hypothetical protein